LQGTLDLLILKVLARSLHGYAIAQRIQQATDAYLRIEEGSLYPALHGVRIFEW
jgi:PadR family transcriptional regulator, regulatory protein PadR